MANANAYANRREQMFPRLTDAQLERVASIGAKRTVTRGEILFEPGDQNSAFFVVLGGAIEIVRPHAEGKDDLITTMGPGEFTGEINMLSARRNLVRGRVADSGT